MSKKLMLQKACGTKVQRSFANQDALLGQKWCQNLHDGRTFNGFLSS